MVLHDECLPHSEETNGAALYCTCRPHLHQALLRVQAQSCLLPILPQQGMKALLTLTFCKTCLHSCRGPSSPHRCDPSALFILQRRIQPFLARALNAAEICPPCPCESSSSSTLIRDIFKMVSDYEASVTLLRRNHGKEYQTYCRLCSFHSCSTSQLKISKHLIWLCFLVSS